MVDAQQTQAELVAEIARLEAELDRQREAQLASFTALREVDPHTPRATLTAEHITQILDSSPIGVGIARTGDSLIIYQNHRYAKIFGAEGQKPRYAKDAWADLREREEFVGAFMRGEPMPDRPARMRRADGSCFWALLTWEWVYVGGVECVLYWIYDITALREAHAQLERAKAELELRVVERTRELERSETLQRTILESLADAVVVCDADARAIHWNGAAKALFVGSAPDEASLTTLFGPSLAERLRAAALTAIREHRSVQIGDHELDGPSPGVATRIVDIVVSPIRDGEPGAVFVLRDVGKQRRLERQVQHAARIDSLGQLSGGIAHDFNNMLNGIIGAAELLTLEAVAPGSPAADHVQLILDTAEQAADLTRKLLTFSRTGQRALALLDVHELIADAVALLRHSVDKRVEISVELGAEHPTIEGDRAQIQNALLNLGINANQAMPDGGRLRIRTRDVELDADACAALPFELAPGPFVELEVEDSGVGMDPRLLAKIFEPFFTTKELGRGTGLGLSMVYGTVESHGGAITVASEPGRRTCFRLLFPRRSGQPEVASTEPMAELPKTLRVLIADDEDAVRRTLGTYFSMQGAEVLHAVDGREALDLIEQQHDRLDLVILDTVMPKLSGADCLRALRKLAPRLPVIMTSGYLKDVALHDLEDLGIGGFLSKPFRLAQLARAVQDAMSGVRIASESSE